MSVQRALRFRDLRLVGKLLVPFLMLMLIAGVLGAFLIVRDLSTRAETTLDESLSRRSLTARSLIHDRELYLIESVNFASNLEGMAAAAERGDIREVTRLLQSVAALKADLTFLTVIDRKGVAIREFLRSRPSGNPAARAGREWGHNDLVRQVLVASAGTKASGFLEIGERPSLAVAAPICSAVPRCRPVGAAIAAITVDALAAEASGRGVARKGRISGAAIFDSSGGLLASAGAVPHEVPHAILRGKGVRQTTDVEGVQTATLYSTLRISGRPIGVLAVSIPTEPAFSSVRGAGFRLAWILLAAMAGVMAIGAFLSRTILRQVQPLLETNAELGSGNLSARAPVLGNDELGELARGVNQMAEQLQASYETLELRVEERTEEVRRLLKERTELFAAMSHEFRTPLAVIMGQADMILDPTYPKSQKWAKETAGTIKRSAAQLLSVVNDILNLAKAEAGELDIDLADVDLAEILSSLRGTIQGLAHGAGLDAAIDLPADLPQVRGDVLRLQEVFINLIDNAVKYTPPGGRVEIHAARERGKVRVSVTDSGVGIPADVGDRIFEPFFRVKSTEAQRGQASSGLGLALTKRLVEAQGGEIDFESEPGEGSTFTITLVAVRRRQEVTSRSGEQQNRVHRA